VWCGGGVVVFIGSTYYILPPERKERIYFTLLCEQVALFPAILLAYYFRSGGAVFLRYNTP
jgi:hypothetical protein